MMISLKIKKWVNVKNLYIYILQKLITQIAIKKHIWILKTFQV